ncbi:sigma-70 family RNA polymerase sigma factor [Asticcacaulis sp. BYS171W]|uniref:Sigma-70 family RNA polymerase sigma factor n=1 Tax=Asticcacaulis aquaticus TaxID=2984212 RepID=A0ABT5HZB5_9CAUL|nr:sigma-70 family RNA polymerase sigma factor [Asticcacaulis aquaticus]
MSLDRLKLVHWIAAHVMPHEPTVRAWLSRSLVSKADVDDLIQEAYCRLSAVQSIEAIARPDGYFFQIVRNLLREQLRRAQLVRIDASAALEDLPMGDEAPSPERVTSAREEWTRVQAAMATLPPRCRQILQMRKIDGLSQRDIAARLGVSESIVENDAVKGMRLIMQHMGQGPKHPRSQRKGGGIDRSKLRR